jgi:exonuclease III
MAQALKIGICNANGLIPHVQEIKLFLLHNNIDIMLISETHFTNKSYLKIPNFNIYHTNHPDGAAHAGTAIIIRKNIKHYEREKDTNKKTYKLLTSSYKNIQESLRFIAHQSAITK